MPRRLVHNDFRAPDAAQRVSDAQLSRAHLLLDDGWVAALRRTAEEALHRVRDTRSFIWIHGVADWLPRCEPHSRTSKRPRRRSGAFAQINIGVAYSVQPAPGWAAAEHAAKRAALDAQVVCAFQGDGRIIGAAGVGVENAPAPFGILAGLHVDQNLLAVLVRLGVDGISAEIGAALLDPDLALFLFRQPHAERRV